MWFWIGVAVVAVAAWLLLQWRSRGGSGPRPFYQTRNDLLATGTYGRFNRRRDETPATPKAQASRA
jgi:hypothetical protein